MNRLFFLALLIFSYSGALVGSEKKAHLQFLPENPVTLKSEASIDLNQSLPGLSLSTKGTQLLKARVSIKGNQEGMPVTSPPLDLSFILDKIKIRIRVNDLDLVFDSDSFDSSLYLNQVSQLIGQPIHLHFNREFQLKDEGGELTQLLKDLPVLQEVKPEVILVDLFLHPFSLAGEELKVGKSYEKTFNQANIPSLPKKLVYKVTAIDDYNIYVSIQGSVEKQTFDLLEPLKVDGEEGLVRVTLNGSVEGKGRWNRDNALLYDQEVTYTYTGMFTLGNLEWMMNSEITIHNFTSY